MNRRRFLAIIGAGATSGMWIDGYGLAPLQKHIVIAITGQCSFCGKSAGNILRLAGVIGRPARICNECIDICLEIYGGEPPNLTPSTLPPDFSVNNNAVAFDFQLPEEMLNAPLPQTEAELEAFIGQPLPQTEAEVVAFIDRWRDLINQARTEQSRIKRSELSCSFCERTRSELQENLLAAPQAYICEYCVREIAESMKAIH